MKQEDVKLALSFTLAGLLLGLIIGYLLRVSHSKGEVFKEVTITDTVTLVDTVPYYQPRQVQERLLAITSKRLPLHIDTIKGTIIDTISNVVASSQNVADTSKSALVEIPITQKKYEGKDYRAYVSGYEPQLDSIFVFSRTTMVRERTYKPPNKWHIGLQGGYGYGRNGFCPYIGVGITYSIISF